MESLNLADAISTSPRPAPWQVNKFGDAFIDDVPAGRDVAFSKQVPCRDALLRVVDAIALDGSTELLLPLHRLLERTLELNARLLCRDIFVATIAILMRRGRAKWAGRLLSEGYFHEEKLKTFVAFHGRMNQEDWTAVAETLPQKHFSVDYYLGVDMMLFARSIGAAVERPRLDQTWLPCTPQSFGSNGVPEILERARCPTGLEALLHMTGFKSKDGIVLAVQSVKVDDYKWGPEWHWVDEVADYLEHWAGLPDVPVTPQPQRVPAAQP